MVFGYPSVCGDGIVLEVVVKMFNRPVCVHESDGNIIKLSAPSLLTNAKPITLGFISASGTGTVNHYISLRSRDDEPLNEDRGEFGIADDDHSSCSKTETTAESVVVTKSSDIGDYMSNTVPLQEDLKLDLLQKCWEPPDTYNFKFDATSKRVFRRPWLEQYKPWLAYSKSQKGAVCRYCVLFPQPVSCGLQGAFIVKPFTNYKDFHDSARSHANCEWHRASHEAATNFINTVTGKSLPISQQVNAHEAVYASL